MKAKKLFAFVVDLFFPPRCICCGEIVPINKTCNCMSELEKLRLPKGKLNLSLNHQLHKYIQDAAAVYHYEGAVKKAIHRFKFEDKDYIARFLGEELALKANECYREQEIDFVVPVPLSKQRLRKRGYNQSLLLANFVALQLAIKCKNNVLFKIVENKEQSRLDKKDRKKNVKGVYTAKNRECIIGKYVLLVDDIITTGATVDECAQILLHAGASKVSVLCIASTSYKG